MSSVLSSYACVCRALPGQRFYIYHHFYEYAVITMFFAFLYKLRQLLETIISSTKVDSKYKVMIS
jgi:hypothetical protein